MASVDITSGDVTEAEPAITTAADAVANGGDGVAMEVEEDTSGSSDSPVADHNVETETSHTENADTSDASDGAKSLQNGTLTEESDVLPAALSPVPSLTKPADDEAPAGPPPIEIAFSFDTTGSMSSCLTQVREQLQDLLERLFSDIPNLKVAVIAHGDYCDVNHYYVTRMVDFTNDLAALSEFVKDVGATGGGDWEECYELVLHQARTQLGWGAAPGTQRSLVMVGDAVPHEPEYHLNTLNLDWREQTDLLKEQLGVRIYSVQCQDDGTARKFWQELAERSKGRYLQLTEFRTILDIMMAICYREKGAEFFDAYETEVRCREGSAIRPELTNLFTALRDGAPRDDGSDVTPTATPRATPTKRARVMPGGAAKKRKTVTPRPAAPRAQLTKITKVRRPPAAGNRRRAKTAAATAIRRAALQHADSLTAAQKPLTPPVKKVAPARLIRETQHEKQFRPDSALTWADWQPCFSHCQLPTGTWERRRAGRPGYRRLDLFWGHTLVPAVYEFAVQVPGSSLCKKHVMYQRTTRGFSALWDGYLVRHAHITAQLDRVLGDRCTVYVRRALLGNTRAVEDVRAQFGRYDYAWSPRGKERRTRRVVRRGVLLAASS